MPELTNISQEELTQLIKEGRAKRVHLYQSYNMLMPRGSMKKESIGETILNRLLGCYEDWTDSEYGDNPDKEEVLKTLYDNLMNETFCAWEEFTKRINNEQT